MKMILTFSAALLFPIAAAASTSPATLDDVLFSSSAKKKICKLENGVNRATRAAMIEGLLDAHDYSVTKIPLDKIQGEDDLVSMLVDPCAFYEKKTRQISADDFVAPLVDTANKIPDSDESPVNFCRQYRHLIDPKKNPELHSLTDRSSAAARALRDYVDSNARKTDEHYRLVGASLVEQTLDPSSPAYNTNRPTALLNALLNENASPKLTVACLEVEKKKPILPQLIVRAKTTELPILKKELKKSKSAEISYTNNAEKGERAFDLRGVIGFQTASRPEKPENPTAEQQQEYDRRIAKLDYVNFSRIPFLEFTYSTIDSDDDAKDKHVRELTPGLQFARNFGIGALDEELSGFCEPFCWRLSGEVSHTFDIAQDARVLRGRVSGELLQLTLGGKSIFDGTDRIDFADDRWGILYRPTFMALSEFGHVFEPGTSEDFMTLDDDQYVALGGKLGLSVRPDIHIKRLAPLNRITLSASYRQLEIVSGGLSDQSLFNAEIEYKLSDNLSIKASYLEGQNINTFQDEELTKIGLGFKY